MLARMEARGIPTRMDALLLLHPLRQGDRPRGEGSRRLFPRAERPRAPSRRGAARALCLRQRVGLRRAPVPRFARRPFSLLKLWNRAEAEGRLFGLVHDGEWFHVGTPQALAEAERVLAMKGVYLDRHRPPLRRRAGGRRAGRNMAAIRWRWPTC